VTTQQLDVERIVEEREELDRVGEQSITTHMLAIV